MCPESRQTLVLEELAESKRKCLTAVQLFNWDSLGSPVAVRGGSSPDDPDPPGRTRCPCASSSAALPPTHGGCCWVVRMAGQAVLKLLESLHALGRLKY